MTSAISVSSGLHKLYPEESGRIDQRFAVNQHNVTTHAPVSASFRKQHSFIKCARIRHKRGGSYHSSSVALHNGTIDAMS